MTKIRVHVDVFEELMNQLINKVRRLGLNIMIEKYKEGHSEFFYLKQKVERCVACDFVYGIRGKKIKKLMSRSHFFGQNEYKRTSYALRNVMMTDKRVKDYVFKHSTRRRQGISERYLADRYSKWIGYHEGKHNIPYIELASIHSCIYFMFLSIDDQIIDTVDLFIEHLITNTEHKRQLKSKQDNIYNISTKDTSRKVESLRGYFFVKDEQRLEEIQININGLNKNTKTKTSDYSNSKEFFEAEACINDKHYKGLAEILDACTYIYLYGKKGNLNIFLYGEELSSNLVFGSIALRWANYKFINSELILFPTNSIDSPNELEIERYMRLQQNANIISHKNRLLVNQKHTPEDLCTGLLPGYYRIWNFNRADYEGKISIIQSKFELKDNYESYLFSLTTIENNSKQSANSLSKFFIRQRCLLTFFSKAVFLISYPDEEPYHITNYTIINNKEGIYYDGAFCTVTRKGFGSAMVMVEESEQKYNGLKIGSLSLNELNELLKERKYRSMLEHLKSIIKRYPSKEHFNNFRDD